MAEAGGPAAQSGILFQNTIAACFLGLLCRDDRDADERVSAVRVEAPEEVDDVVVTFESGRRESIHAKERLDPRSSEFASVFESFARASVGQRDTFRLYVGYLPIYESLREAAERARGAEDENEWRRSLNKKQTEACAKIASAVPALAGAQLFALMKRVYVDVTSLDLLEKHSLPEMLPSTSVPKRALARLLRDRIGGNARVRKTFRREELVADLLSEGVVIASVAANEHAYCDAVARRYARLRIPGTSIHGDAATLYVPPRLRVLASATFASLDSTTPYHEQERFEREGPRVGLDALVETSAAIVVAPAGFGKSELTRALARRHVEEGFVPALLGAGDLLERGTSVLTALAAVINDAFSVAVDWARLADAGRAVLILDGLDELDEHGRAIAISRLNDFSSRFGSARWVLTVRDEAALIDAPEATVLALEPWEGDERVALASAFFQDASLGARLCTRIGRNADLERLARIPLFLALLVDEVRGDPAGELPSRRTDILLRYVDRILRPDPDPAKKRLASPARHLRDAVEALALRILDLHAQRIRRDDALAALDSVAGNSEAILDDLVAAGLVRSERGRLHFVFPLLRSI